MRHLASGRSIVCNVGWQDWIVELVIPEDLYNSAYDPQDPRQITSQGRIFNQWRGKIRTTRRFKGRQPVTIGWDQLEITKKRYIPAEAAKPPAANAQEAEADDDGPQDEQGTLW